MQQIQIIGNLGEDCQVREFNGRKFIAFRVACSDKVQTAEGPKEVTTWYSCTFGRMDSGVIQYLVKGTKVFVQGRPSYKMYDSATFHCKMIDVSIFVDVVQLCGGRSDQPSPSQDQSGDDVKPF